MRAFHHDPAIKAKYVARVEGYEKAGSIARFSFWNPATRTGGATGCTLERDDPAGYASELGIPRWLALLEDTVFNSMPVEPGRSFPREFLSAIRVGAELQRAKPPFVILMARDLLQKTHYGELSTKPELEATIALWQRHDIGAHEWKMAAGRDPGAGPRVLRALQLEEDARAAAWTLSDTAKSLAQQMAWPIWTSGPEAVMEKVKADGDEAAWNWIVNGQLETVHAYYADQLLTILRTL